MELISKIKRLYFKQKKLFLISGFSLVLVSLLAVNVFLQSQNFSSSTKASSGIIYYVSSTGSDTNSGLSTTTAWKTLDKVNSINFEDGDSILLEGGSTFLGQIYLDFVDGGTEIAPLRIGSYGNGKANIKPNQGQDAIFSYNAAGFLIENLIITGPGASFDAGTGINHYNELANNSKLPGITIRNVEVSGFKQGVSIGGWNGNTGFKNVLIDNVIAHDNSRAGIITYAELPYSHENVKIQNSQAYNNLGVRGYTKTSGSGIVIGGAKGGSIEHSIAYDNGANCDANECGVGIWAYDSSEIIIQYNESYNNKTASGVDGDGFDLDQNTTNSILQYNYSHGNDGAGYLLCQGIDSELHTGNIVRYNISENDARYGSYGAIQVYGKVKNAEVYNNTVYITPTAERAPKAVSVANWVAETLDVTGLHFRNNIFQTTGGLQLIEITTGQPTTLTAITFQNNSYFTSGSPFSILWGSNTFSSLENWRSSTNQEKVGTTNTGFTVDPQLTSPGTGGTIGNTQNLKSLTGYKLKSSSVLINKGLNLQTSFNINPGTKDFYGNTVPLGGNYDIGAHEYETTTSTTVTPTPSVTATTFKVTTGNDDAEERISTKSVNLSDSDLELGADGSNPQIVGLRFQNVTIPKNAVIKNAYLEFLVDESKTAATNLTIYGQASDNAAAFSTSTGNISLRTKTQAASSWSNIPSWTTIDSVQKSPDVTSILSEITSRSGWISNNALVITLAGTGTRTARSYNTSSSKSPRLVVTYETTGSTVTTTPSPSLSPTPTATTVTTVTPTTTTIPGATVNLTTIADTYVHSGTPTSNFGTKTSLTVVGSPVAISYLKFDLTSLTSTTVSTAKLKLKVTNDSSNVHTVKYLSDTSWSESTLNYNNQPSLASATVLASFTPSTAGSVIEIDISTFIQSNKGKIISLVVDSSGTNTSGFNSREATADKPVLVIN